MSVSTISSKEEILSLLDEFSEYMPRLSGKIESYESYAEKLSKKAVVAFSEENDVRTGIIVFYANDMTGYTGFVSLIVVKEAFRSKGLGKELLRYACETMRNNSMDKIQLVVDKNNNKAIGFYKHLGFAIIKEETNGFLMDKLL